jgi:diguanylate cyclase (GGDEF)-like protein/PAS domain S-box-containing protein
VNPRFTETTGYTAEEAIGSNPRILKTEFKPSSEYKELWDTILSGQSWHGLFQNKKKNGELYWESATISPVKDEKGSVTHFLAVKEDITERKIADAELRRAQDALEAAHRELQQSFAREQKLARMDDQTGINNHRFLMQLAEREFNVAMRYRQSFSIMFFDIDYFKQINDTFGHEMGDQVLKMTIRTVCTMLRSTDLIGRYGGDEFVILLPHTSAEDALPLAERIHVSLAAMHLDTENGPLRLTISIGLAQLDHDTSQPDTVEYLLHRADQALYAAKQAGRNCIRIFDPDIPGSIK